MDYTVKNKAWCGVDPGGVSGAIALITENEAIVEDYTTVGEIVELLIEWKTNYNIKMVLMENVSSMHGWGIKGCFSFGINVGEWHGMLSALAIPFDKISPKKWQKDILGSSKIKDTKKESLIVAKRLFPNIKIKKTNHGKSDALLISEYCRRAYG